MEALLILISIVIGLAVLLAPIGVLVLSRRVRELTARVGQLEAGVPPIQASQKVSDQSQPWGPVRETVKPAATAPKPAPLSTPAQPEQRSDQAPQTPRSFVFNTDKASQAANWLRENWFLGIAALSLALAGVFLVQYGAEQGLLTPFARIMGALGLGALLIAGGEVVRRRYGDEGGTMQTLPSTLSGAGIVTLFAAVLAARHLYDMLPSDLAFYALIGVAALAVALGWFYGPFLAAVGILGAIGAPFVVGGSSDAPHLFYYYFALIVVMALAIDTVRRWAWVSVLALIAGTAAVYVITLGGAGVVHALAYALICTFAAFAIPQRRIWPDHGGATLTEGALKIGRKQGLDWPEFPTRLASGMFLAASLFAAFAVLDADLMEGWLGLWLLFALGALVLLWAYRAQALQDLAVVPVLGLIALVPVMRFELAPLYAAFAAVSEAEVPPFKWQATVLSAMIAGLSMMAFWRASRGVRLSLLWAFGAAFALPVMLGALELFWSPAEQIGNSPWAGHAIAGAALMTLFAERAARRWPADLRPSALYAMSALSLITFALVLVLSQAALSVALAVMIVIAALIDRRLDMKLLGYFIQVGVAVLGWRIIVDPGVPWASWWNTPLWEVLLGTAVPIALLAMAWWLVRPRRRVGAQLALESAVWTYGAVLVLILLERALRSEIDSFWGLSLAGCVLLVSMGAQLYRWRRGMRLGWLRIGLAALFGVLSFLTLLVALVLFSPISGFFSTGEVDGPLLLDTIAIGYLTPALIFAVLAWKLDHLHLWLRRGFGGLSALLVSAYVALEIRRFWQGGDMARGVVSQGELYSYTVALLLASVGLLLFAFQRRSEGLRKLAMAGIALTIAKVFLVDMSGLTGLIRVASFLGLGLALTGLAWLNRAMQARWDEGPKP